MSKDTNYVSPKSHVIELSIHGHNLLKAKRFDEAFNVYKEALAIDAQNPYLLNGIGDVLRHQKKFADASEMYRQALAIEPYNPFSLLGMGDALRGFQRYNEAIAYWKLYLQHCKKNNIYVLTRIADSYKRLNDYDNALSYYREGFVVAPNDRYVLLGLADLYKSKGLDSLAIEHYEKAISNGVTSISILTIAGNLHLKHNNYENAKDYFEKVLEQEPYNNHALHGLGNYYRKKCEYQRAAEQWEKCLEKDSCTVYMLSRLGDAYRNLGKYEDAERSYLKGLEKGYDKFNLLGIMKLWCQMGRLKDVCDCYDELFHREGTDTRFAIEAGQLLMQYEKSEMALEFYRHAQQLQINSPEAVAVIDTCILQLKDSHRTHLKFTPKTEHAPPLV